MSGSLAAALAFVIGLIAVSIISPAHVDAAEQLRNAAVATEGFKGWVHLKAVAPNGAPADGEWREMTIHLNTIDGRYAIEGKQLGMRLTAMFSQTKREMYTDLSGTIVVSSAAVDFSDATKRAAEFPLKLADLLRQIKSRGLAMPAVAESTDQRMQRFDLTLGDDAKKAMDAYPEMSDGKLTLWVDPQTKYIRTRSTGQLRIIGGQLAGIHPLRRSGRFGTFTISACRERLGWWTVAKAPRRRLGQWCSICRRRRYS